MLRMVDAVNVIFVDQLFRLKSQTGERCDDRATNQRNYLV